MVIILKGDSIMSFTLGKIRSMKINDVWTLVTNMIRKSKLKSYRRIVLIEKILFSVGIYYKLMLLTSD